MNPRERRLVVALGVTFIVCILGWAGFTVSDAMAEKQAKNDEMRKALHALARHRVAAANHSEDRVEIPEQALSLDSYLDGIVKDLGLPSPSYPTPKESVKGQFTELSIRVSLKGLTIYQMKDFLEKVETNSPLVATSEITVDRNFSDKEKLDLDVTVSTFRRTAAKKDSKKGGKKGSKNGGKKDSSGGKSSAGDGEKEDN